MGPLDESLLLGTLERTSRDLKHGSASSFVKFGVQMGDQVV